MSTKKVMRLAALLEKSYLGLCSIDALAAAAELRRQHAEIEALTAERDALKLTAERLHQHNVTTWNAGHTLGLMAGQKALTQAQDALQRDAWGNTQLTEALLAAEAERDALRAALQRIVDWDAAGLALTEDHINQARAALQQPKEQSNG